MKHRLLPGAFLVLTLVARPAFARPHQALDFIDALDQQITVALQYLAEGNVKQARLLARQMAWRFPEFTLGQSISAELEAA